MRGSWLGWSLGSILGRVFICFRDIVLPTVCAYLPTSERLLVLLMIPFPIGRAQRSFPKEGRQKPPCIGFFDGEILYSCLCRGEVFPCCYHYNRQRLSLPIPLNEPIEKVDDDGRGGFGWPISSKIDGM